MSVAAHAEQREVLPPLVADQRLVEPTLPLEDVDRGVQDAVLEPEEKVQVPAEGGGRLGIDPDLDLETCARGRLPWRFMYISIHTYGDASYGYVHLNVDPGRLFTRALFMWILADYSHAPSCPKVVFTLD